MLILLIQALPALAAEITIVSGNATAGLWKELGPQFERATGHKLILFKGPGTTTGVRQRIESGESFDLAIIPTGLMDEFTAKAKFVADTQTPFVRVGMGVATRAGGPKPDISSTETFKRTLLDAKSITYVPQGEVALQLGRSIERLGIAEQVKSKAKPQPTSAQCIQLITDGDADLFFSLTNIIALARDLELVGPFPPELQHYLELSAGVSATAKEPDAAKQLLKFLMSEAATPVIKAKGLDRATR